MKEAESKSSKIQTGIEDERVVHLLNIPAFRQRIVSVREKNPIDFSFGIYGPTRSFPVPQITDLNLNRDGQLACRKDFNPNARDFYRRPTVALGVIRSLSTDLFIPKISDLEDLVRVNAQTPFKGVILAECGIKTDRKNVEFLFLKPRDDHGTWTFSKMADEIKRLEKFLPKRKSQEKIHLDLTNSGFQVARYTTTFDFLTTSTGTLRTDFKFA